MSIIEMHKRKTSHFINDSVQRLTGDLQKVPPHTVMVSCEGLEPEDLGLRAGSAPY